jgi:hypothetical protein
MEAACLYDAEGRFLGVGTVDAGGVLRARRLMNVEALSA